MFKSPSYLTFVECDSLKKGWNSITLQEIGLVLASRSLSKGDAKSKFKVPGI